MTAHAHHSIDYVEIAVTDIEATQAFYGAAFGFTFNDYGPAYCGFIDGEGRKEAGGFRRAEAVTEGGPLVILYSRDLEASRAAVLEAGGRLAQDIYDFPGGRRFELLDPSGNRLAVWSDCRPQ